MFCLRTYNWQYKLLTSLSVQAYYYPSYTNHWRALYLRPRGVDNVSPESAVREGPQRYRITKSIVSLFGLYSFLRSLLFWDVTKRRFTLEDGTDRLSRNVGHYQSTLRNIPQKRRSHLHSSGSLRSRMYLGSALFWDFMQRRLVISYRRFGTTYWSHLQG